MNVASATVEHLVLILVRIPLLIRRDLTCQNHYVHVSLSPAPPVTIPYLLHLRSNLSSGFISYSSVFLLFDLSIYYSHFIKLFIHKPAVYIGAFLNPMFQPDIPRCSPTTAAYLSFPHPCIVCIFAFVFFVVVLSTVAGRSRERMTQPLMTCSLIDGPLPAQLFYVSMLKLEFNEKAGALNKIAHTL